MHTSRQHLRFCLMGLTETTKTFELWMQRSLGCNFLHVHAWKKKFVSLSVKLRNSIVYRVKHFCHVPQSRKRRMPKGRKFQSRNRAISPLHYAGLRSADPCKGNSASFRKVTLQHKSLLNLLADSAQYEKWNRYYTCRLKYFRFMPWHSWDISFKVTDIYGLDSTGAWEGKWKNSCEKLRK